MHYSVTTKPLMKQCPCALGKAGTAQCRQQGIACTLTFGCAGHRAEHEEPLLLVLLLFLFPLSLPRVLSLSRAVPVLGGGAVGVLRVRGAQQAGGLALLACGVWGWGRTKKGQ